MACVVPPAPRFPPPFAPRPALPAAAKMAAEVDFGDRELFGQLEGEPGPPSPPALEEPDPLLQLYERLRDRDETVQRLRAENILAVEAGPAPEQGKAGAPLPPVPFRASRPRPSRGASALPGGLWERTLGLRRSPGAFRRGRVLSWVGRGSRVWCSRASSEHFSIETFILRAAGRVPAPPQEAAPSWNAGMAVETAVTEFLRSAFPGKTNACVFALTIHFNAATNNFKWLNWNRFPEGFLGLPLPQNGI